MSKYENEEEVWMTCNTSELDIGNSECRQFTWYKTEENYRTFPRKFKDKQWMFTMKEIYGGTYQCTCYNGYGESDKSDPVSLEFLN